PACGKHHRVVEPNRHGSLCDSGSSHLGALSPLLLLLMLLLLSMSLLFFLLSSSRSSSPPSSLMVRRRSACPAEAGLGLFCLSLLRSGVARCHCSSCRYSCCCCCCCFFCLWSSGASIPLLSGACDCRWWCRRWCW
ncbi:unnamed protein product, partial [Pylaiella littoralis]